VGLLASNGLDYAVVVLACQLGGITLVPLPGLVAHDALARMIADAGVTVLFHDRDHAEKARTSAVMRADEGKVSCVEIGLVHADGSHGLLDAWLGAGTSPFTPTVIDDDWISDLIYSSGTTGTPKGVAQSYGARKEQCISLAQFGVTRETRSLQTVGLCSNYGFSSLLLSLWWGGTFFIMRKFSAEAAVVILARETIDMAWMPPATLIRTVEAPGFRTAVAGKPCIKICAGAPLSETHKLQVLEQWPGPFYDVYGQTETGTLTVLAMHAIPPAKLKSVGKVLPTVQVRIIDDAGRVLGPGVEGEIVGQSSTLMTGYHQRDDANASAYWRDEAGRLYIRTGDIGKIDEDGFLWLCDRKKDMIISGGYNVYPADIERVAGDHPAVFEVAVVGCASAKWGESPVAFLTLRDGETADPDELRAWINARVGAVQRVAAVKILAELPNGAMGKILKRELRETHADAIGTLP